MESLPPDVLVALLAAAASERAANGGPCLDARDLASLSCAYRTLVFRAEAAAALAARALLGASAGATAAGEQRHVHVRLLAFAQALAFGLRARDGTRVRLQPCAAGTNHTLLCDVHGSLVVLGASSLRPHAPATPPSTARTESAAWSLVEGAPAAPTRFVTVASSPHHNLAVTADGELYIFGSCRSHASLPMFYASSMPPVADPWLPRRVCLPCGVRIVAVAAGDCHSAAVSACGALFTWLCSRPQSQHNAASRPSRTQQAGVLQKSGALLHARSCRRAEGS